MPPVGRVNITAADAVGTAPITTIELADNLGDPTADDLHDIAATALANDAYRATAISGKVAKAGDTMFGKLTISPSTAVQGLQVSAGAGSNQNAIQATGDGIGPAIVGTGGSNAAGASFTAGGGDNFGARGIGAGNEVGLEGSGGTTGAGVRARAGTASTDTAPTIAILSVDGGMTMTGVVSPKSDVDPGQDFCQFPQSMITASAILECTAGTKTIRTVGGKKIGFNIASWTGDAMGVATVTFTRALPGNNYRMHIDASDGYDARWNGVQNVGNFQFIVRNATTNATVDLTTETVTISVSCVGF